MNGKSISISLGEKSVFVRCRLLLFWCSLLSFRSVSITTSRLVVTMMIMMVIIIIIIIIICTSTTMYKLNDRAVLHKPARHIPCVQAHLSIILTKYCSYLNIRRTDSSDLVGVQTGTWIGDVRTPTTQCTNIWQASWSSYLSAYLYQNKKNGS